MTAQRLPDVRRWIIKFGDRRLRVTYDEAHLVMEAGGFHRSELPREALIELRDILNELLA